MIRELFNSYEFTFAGESCLSYGLMIYDFNGVQQDNVAFGNSLSIMETRTNRRISPIHHGVNYNGKPLEFKLVFGAERPLDRFEIERISFWLTGYPNYQWLTIDQPDLSHVQFRCLITSLKPLTHGWLPVAFEATVRCDCPYAYSIPIEMSYSVNGSTAALIRNDSSVRECIKPVLEYTASGTAGLKIINHSDGERQFSISSIQTGSSVRVDNENGIIQDVGGGTNLYPHFNMNFFRLIPGDNQLTISGKGTLRIQCRFFHNVAG